jgi:hypothetical protein
MGAYRLLGSVEHGLFDEIVTKINNHVVDVVDTGRRPDRAESMAALPRILPRRAAGFSMWMTTLRALVGLGAMYYLFALFRDEHFEGPSVSAPDGTMRSALSLINRSAASATTAAKLF